MAVAQRTFRWGLLGTGRIANDFATALTGVPGAKLAAVASNHAGRLATTGAEAFAEAHDIPSVFDSYSDLAASEDIDICYISSLNPAHKDDAIGCLKQGKHVVVEKPMAMGRDDAAEMIAAAQANSVFFMEGMWTRFFPAIRHARQLIRAGAIGEVVHAMADFGFECTDGPDSRMFDRSLGGGGLLDIGCYTIDAATIAFENRPLTAVLAQGEIGETGVDHAGNLVLSYGASSTGAGKGSASLLYSLRANTLEQTMIYGTQGHIQIHPPAHCPSRLTVTRKNDGEKPHIEVLEFPLPEMDENESYNYPNQQGFCYQITAVQECIAAGLLESPEYTHAEMLQNASVLELAAHQMGMKTVGTVGRVDGMTGDSDNTITMTIPGATHFA